MKRTFTFIATTMLIFTAMLAPTKAMAQDVAFPGDVYSFSELGLPCSDYQTYGYDGSVRILDSSNTEVASYLLEVNVITDDYGDCSGINVAADFSLPDIPDFYVFSISLLYNGTEFYSGLGSQSVSVIDFQVANVDTKIASLTPLIPDLKLDVAHAPILKVQYRLRTEDGFAAEYCPASITLQFRKSGTTSWKALSIVKRTTEYCSSDSSVGYQTLSFQSAGAGAIRAVVDGKATPAKAVKIVKTKSKFRFIKMSTNIKSVKWVSDPVNMSANLEQQLANGKWVTPFAPAGKIKVQKYTQGSWKAAGTCKLTHSAVTRVTCGPVANVSGLRLRMVYGAINVTTKTSTAKKPVLKSLYIYDDWPSCYYLSGMKIYAGALGSNGKNWTGKVKIVLQFRASRYDKWENIDYDYQTKSEYAILYQPNCYESGWYRLMVPGTSIVLESGLFS